MPFGHSDVSLLSGSGTRVRREVVGQVPLRSRVACLGAVDHAVRSIGPRDAVGAVCWTPLGHRTARPRPPHDLRRSRSSVWTGDGIDAAPGASRRGRRVGRAGRQPRDPATVVAADPQLGDAVADRVGVLRARLYRVLQPVAIATAPSGHDVGALRRVLTDASRHAPITSVMRRRCAARRGPGRCHLRARVVLRGRGQHRGLGRRPTVGVLDARVLRLRAVRVADHAAHRQRNSRSRRSGPDSMPATW